MKRIASTITMLCATAAVWAQTQAPSEPQPQQKEPGSIGLQEESAVTRSHTEIRHLMNAEIKSSTGEDLGKIQDVLVSPQTGQVRFVVLSRGGLLGLGDRRVPIPWQALSVQSEHQFTLNIEKVQLESAPTTDSKYSNLSDPSQVAMIYKFYRLGGSAIGGGEPPGGSETRSGKNPGAATKESKSDGE